MAYKEPTKIRFIPLLWGALQCPLDGINRCSSVFLAIAVYAFFCKAIAEGDRCGFERKCNSESKNYFCLENVWSGVLIGRILRFSPNWHYNKIIEADYLVCQSPFGKNR
jgi:hypothetical protein